MVKRKQPTKKPKSDRDHLRQLAKRTRQDPFTKDMRLLYEPAGEVKMSDVIDELVAPYMSEIDSAEQFSKLVSVAVIAWNNTLLPQEARAKGFEVI